MATGCSRIELQNRQYATLQGLIGENIYNVAAPSGSHEEDSFQKKAPIDNESQQISTHVAAPSMEKQMKSLIILSTILMVLSVLLIVMVLILSFIVFSLHHDTNEVMEELMLKNSLELLVMIQIKLWRN